MTAVLAPLCAGAQTRNWPSESPPRPLPARPFNFPPYEVRTLPNGMQVVVVVHNAQPVVSMRLLIRAGCAQDPAGKAGTANLAASLLDQGTTTRSAQQIAGTIDSVGGELRTAAGTDLSFGAVTVMKDSFDLGLDLLSDVVRHPAFATEELDRQRQQVRSALRVSNEDPTYVATTVFERLVYGGHPYGMPGNGTLDSVDRITREDLVSFHERYFAPNNSLLAIVGDVNAEEAFAAAARVLGSWARKDLPVSQSVETPAPARRLIIVDKPDASQTEIHIGHIAIPRKSKDYLSMDLAIRILGGEGSNRLHQVLRTDRGLAYGAEADLNTYKQTGDVTAKTETRSEATGEALRLMVDEFFRLQREEVRERELESAKAYLTGNFPLTLQTPDAIASQVLTALFYELPLDELQTYRRRVDAVSVQEVQWVARNYLRPDRLSMVLVGDAAAFVDRLKGVGFKNSEIVPLAELDLTEPDFKRRKPSQPPATHGQARFPPDPDAAPQGTAEDRRSAKAIIMRAVEATGGLARLQAIKTVMATASTVLYSPQGQLRAETTTYIEYPDRFRVEANLPVGTLIQAYADGHAWIKDPNGVHDAPDGMRDEIRMSVHRDLVAVLVAAATDTLTCRMLPREKAEGDRLLDVVELRGEALGSLRLFLDPTTGRVDRQSYETRGPAGTETITEEFSQYGQVDQLWLPARSVVRREGTPLVERTVLQFVLNRALPANLFQKPQ
jgi:zinc protease